MSSALAAAIAAELEPMIRKAEAEKLLIYCRYGNLWFSPRMFREDLAQGRFLWGRESWQLRPPADLVNEMAAAVEKACNMYSGQLAHMRKEGLL